MNDKTISTVYGTLSVIIWTVFISLIIFVIALFIIGENQKPVFQIENVILTEVSDGAATDNFAGKKKFEVNIYGSITGAVLSPYTYTADEIVMLPDNALETVPKVTLDTPLTYSKTKTDAFIITLYIEAGDIIQARDILSGSCFALRNLKQRYAFLEKEIQIYLPYFSLSDNDFSF